MLITIEKKYIYVSAGILAAFSAIISGVLIFVHPKKNPEQITLEASPKIISENLISGESAEIIASAKAGEWRPDAVLSFMSSEPALDGNTESWKLIFISAKAPKKGFEITLNKKEIISAREIDYSGKGAEFPEKPDITQEEAIRRVKRIPGYESAEVLKVEAVYGPAGQKWYWGVETDKGMVSVEIK